MTLWILKREGDGPSVLAPPPPISQGNIDDTSALYVHVHDVSTPNSSQHILLAYTHVHVISSICMYLSSFQL